MQEGVTGDELCPPTDTIPVFDNFRNSTIKSSGVKITDLAKKTDLSSLASTSYVDTKVASLVSSAPETLDTLNELAKALGNDPNFATTVSTQIGGKVSKAGDTMTGALSIGDGVTLRTNGYMEGSWVQAKGTGDLNATSTRIVVMRESDGWFYYRTTSEILNDIKALPLAGGTLDAGAQIQRAGISKTWVKGREAAIVRVTTGGSGTNPIYAPVFSQKSLNGSWEFGAYTGNTAYLSYITDTDYNNNNNVQTAYYQFAPNKKGIVAVTTDITWANTANKPSWIGSSKPS